MRHPQGGWTFNIKPVTKTSVLRARNETPQRGTHDDFVSSSSHSAGRSGPRQETVSFIRHMAVLMPCTRNMTNKPEEEAAS